MLEPRTVSALLIVAGLCFVACQRHPPSDEGNLDDLIGSIFTTVSPSAITARPSASGSNGNLEDLIGDVFHNGGANGGNKNTDPRGPDGGTYLGVDNENRDNGGNACECVPYYQCQDGKILDDGVGLIDIRVSGPCENYLDICCKIPNIIKPEDKITPRPVRQTGCGQRHIDGVGFRITGNTDNEAQFGEFPWMVAILQEQVINGKTGQELVSVYQCGGALIHPRAVLTAAHCVANKLPELLHVRAGEWDTQTENEIYPHQNRNVSNIIIHENFHAGSLRNDFAILILSTPVELAENVDVVCLPEENDRFDASRCFASGWGKDIFGKEGHYQAILKKIELPLVPHNVCQNTLRSTRLGRYFVLNESFVCAGGEAGKDTCKGDGGSPLVCPMKNDRTRYVQAGIVAWGIGCGENAVPGVYANVAGARRWIDEKMAYNNLDTTVYQYDA